MIFLIFFCQSAHNDCAGQKTDQVGKNHEAVEHIRHIPYQIHLQRGTCDDKNHHQNRIDFYCFVSKKMAHIDFAEVIPSDDGGEGEEQHTDGNEYFAEGAECRVKSALGQGRSGQAIVPDPGRENDKGVSVRMINVSMNTPIMAIMWSAGCFTSAVAWA